MILLKFIIVLLLALFGIRAPLALDLNDAQNPPPENPVALAEPAERAAATPEISVRVADGKLAEPYVGRVYVQIAPAGRFAGEPRLANRWMDPPVILALDVDDWDGEKLALTDAPLAFPMALNELEAGAYRAQAFLRMDRFSADPGQGIGDLFSKPADFVIRKDGSDAVDLVIDQIESREPPKDSDQIKWISLRSELLSTFHGFDYPLEAGVRFPKDWAPEIAAEFPILILIGGFTDDHISAMNQVRQLGSVSQNAVIITPNARNFHGHSVFVDSDTSGPWGTALMTELLPAIDQRFGLAGASKRYVTGISSGGWAGLWLQIQWPDEFQHVWSFVPDPVDFRDFQRINLYQNDNFYFERNGDRRLIGTFGDFRMWYDDFVKHEEVLGPGMQIHSFEATFGPRGADGNPLPLFDRNTGVIDPEVAEAFKRFDINLVLSEKWHELEPKLKGKLTVIAGAEDNFFLQGAVRHLKKTMEDLGAEADIRIVPGLGHQFDPATLREMSETLKQAR